MIWHLCFIDVIIFSVKPQIDYYSTHSNARFVQLILTLIRYQYKEFMIRVVLSQRYNNTTLSSYDSQSKNERLLECHMPIHVLNVSMCFSRSVPKLGVEGIEAYGLDKLIQFAASQLSDQLPESREAARALLLELQSVYEKITTTVTEDQEAISWEQFCQSKLSPLNAQAVLRVTNVPREGLVQGS
ncbi:PREDICTED: uncharacterized protein LOC109164030 isoform X2 [Ipomoea nil]|uniref:uncharacterized protein LOC109164030 isoform X2 n=1 Tax=Ipomoea nil TaxID=35883 RepID=UPI00090162F5|nr:PREDICTED: uncharacterized protein LOC109164030 isoform X2 [Ipomoea nil]